MGVLPFFVIYFNRCLFIYIIWFLSLSPSLSLVIQVLHNIFYSNENRCSLEARIKLSSCIYFMVLPNSSPDQVNPSSNVLSSRLPYMQVAGRECRSAGEVQRVMAVVYYLFFKGNFNYSSCECPTACTSRVYRHNTDTTWNTNKDSIIKVRLHTRAAPSI